MAIMEVVLQQLYSGQVMQNRFNYLSSGTPASVSWSFALADALGAIASAGVYPSGGLMDLIASVQQTAVSFTQVTFKNVYDPTDFYEVPFVDPLNGTRSGEGGASFLALGFRTNRTRLDIRRATKRFGGISESDIASGGAIESTFKAGAVADLAAGLTEVWTYDDEGNVLTFAPIVVAKERYDVPGSDPVRHAYQYYEDPSEQLDHIMQSIIWDPYDYIRSQVSRQRGRGA